MPPQHRVQQDPFIGNLNIQGVAAYDLPRLARGGQHQNFVHQRAGNAHRVPVTSLMGGHRQFRTASQSRGDRLDGGRGNSRVIERGEDHRLGIQRRQASLERTQLAALRLRVADQFHLAEPRDTGLDTFAMVPEDRKRNGVFLKLPIKENILMSSLKKCMRGPLIRGKLERKYFEEYAEKLEIKYSSLSQTCKNLSGGNQQKVAVSRVLNADPDIIILDEPTRGIDVKTKAEIHRLMSSLAGTGKAILMVSSELPEILGMSDRILVLHEGVQTGIMDRKDATADKIMELAVKTERMEVQ